jgi:hypothetical protein
LLTSGEDRRGWPVSERSSTGGVGARRGLHARRRRYGNVTTSRSSSGCAAWLEETPGVDGCSSGYLVRRDDAAEPGSYGGVGALQRGGAW